MTLRVRSTKQISRRPDRGAALVEFALLAPVLIAILLGMITGGLALAEKNSMTNAIREGARLGATLPADTTVIADDDDGVLGWDGWAVKVKDRVDALAAGDLDDDEVCVRIEEVGGSVLGSWPASPPGCGLSTAAPTTPTSAIAGSCIVKVWGERDATLNALFFSHDLALTANAIGLYERTDCP